jgi:hypothetical protein
MTIMRIAFAAVALYYIAPHIGSEVIKSARPTLQHAKANINPDTLTQTALEYCKKNTQACLKFAAKATSAHEAINQEKPMAMPINAALRSTLPDSPPLPPVKAVELLGKELRGKELGDKELRGIKQF